MQGELEVDRGVEEWWAEPFCPPLCGVLLGHGWGYAHPTGGPTQWSSGTSGVKTNLRYDS